MNFIDLILEDKYDEIKEKLKQIDINFTINGFGLLWVAINGSTARPQQKLPKVANYEIVKLFLDSGIDVNKKHVLMTNLYTSLIHERDDITRLLLMYGADPNDYSVIKVQKGQMLCEVPLNLAIKNYNVNLVRLLLTYGALFNNTTIDIAEERLKALKKEDVYMNYNMNYKKLKKIVKLLKSNYKPEYEDKVKDLIEKAKKCGSLTNHFTCFSLTLDQILKLDL